MGCAQSTSENSISIWVNCVTWPCLEQVTNVKYTGDYSTTPANEGIWLNAKREIRGICIKDAFPDEYIGTVRACMWLGVRCFAINCVLVVPM
eukprot:5738338-Pyramimonas_sp.AAC.2